MLYSPLSFKVMQEKQGRSLIDFGAEVQPHLSGLWIAPDKFIKDKPEVVRITCDLHSWMVGWVVVAAHPFYAITGADGQFAFDNLPR